MRISRKEARQKYDKVIIITAVLIILALGIQLGILNQIHKNNDEKASVLLLDRIIDVLDDNQEEERVLTETLKEEYIDRAKVVSYIIDTKPGIENEWRELQKIAQLTAVDEIHLFTPQGVIYGGTYPPYYGHSLDSGEQMAFFKPMLTDTSLSLCQDMMPNTSLHKKMMYAMVWNEKKTHMVEVGINPVRLLREINRNSLSEVVSRIPTYEGLKVFIADKDTGEIYGATDTSKIGKKLDDIGIVRQKTNSTNPHGLVDIDGEEYHATFKFSGPYTIGVTWSTALAWKSNLTALGLVAGYLLLAALIIMYMVMKVLKTGKERDSQFGIMVSMSRIYRSMDLVNIESDTYINYSSHIKLPRKRKVHGNAKAHFDSYMKQRTDPEDWEKVQHFIDFDTLPKRLEDHKIISMDYMSKDYKWFRASFIVIYRTETGMPQTLLFTTRDIDENKRWEEKLLYTSHTDELTQCFNRRAYIKDSQLAWSRNQPFTLISMDVNGLKPVNDHLGHAAGDELIQGAASCMQQCFGAYGNIYRVGGDEFMALLTAPDVPLGKMEKGFKEVLSAWSGDMVKTMSVSSGYVSSGEKHWSSLEEMEREADNRMYEDKKTYYIKPEHDRRK